MAITTLLTKQCKVILDSIKIFQLHNIVASKIFHKSQIPYFGFNFSAKFICCTKVTTEKANLATC